MALLSNRHPPITQHEQSLRRYATGRIARSAAGRELYGIGLEHNDAHPPCGHVAPRTINGVGGWQLSGAGDSGGFVKIANKVGLVVQRNPLVWALPLQALLLLSNLDLLDPWGDEWSTVTIHVAQPLSQVVFIDPMHPPLYHVLVHYWIQLPWTLTPVATMRAMSAVWALVATVVIYALWLRREGPRFQAMFLALWVLSPCLLLHARMARSYSMQLVLASLAIYTALHWAEQPRNWKRLLAYVGSNNALLYTQYLSGLAIVAGVWVAFALKKRFTLAAVQMTLLVVLYMPWVPTLGSSLGYWIDNSQSYEGGNISPTRSSVLLT